MMRSNKLPDVPDSIKGADIDIVYTGPLAASSNMEDAQLLQTYLNIVNMVAEVKPQIMDNINEDHIARSLADDLNIDPGVNNSKEEVEALRAARQQQEQAAFEAQNLQEGGKAMQEMAKGEQAMRGEPNA
jgi:FKBP-type peptidyl-prolyl cis-trans isomerase (trigger factor)